MTPEDTLTVFVIDDDAAVRASIQGLLMSVSLRSEVFGTAESSCTASDRMAPVALFST
jgi:FixJ family two-component response regulator